MIKRYFITGTDTNIGKTLSVCALLQSIIRSGQRVIGCKLVASGCKKTKYGLRNSDVIKIMKINNIILPYSHINPFAFFHPTSPHIASEKACIKIYKKDLSYNLKKLSSKTDWLIIEGAGGWYVPININFTYDKWVKLEKIPVILVIGIKLGCINHALLTFEAICNAKIPFVGWIANNIDKNMLYKHKYIAFLKKKLSAPMIGNIPFLKKKDMRDNLYKYIFLKYL
ncbi:MAG: dethiobiotin synthase [Wigglesworthia glossinidia]|nr:dethiobiotin synthase [Wigglesworthia glossinidia]